MNGSQDFGDGKTVKHHSDPQGEHMRLMIIARERGIECDAQMSIDELKAKIEMGNMDAPMQVIRSKWS